MISILLLEISKIMNLDIVQGFRSLNISVFGNLGIWIFEKLRTWLNWRLAHSKHCKFKIKSWVVVYDSLIR